MQTDIVFYQQHATPYFGILRINEYLKKSNFTSDIIINSIEKNPIKIIKELKPKLIGFSVMTTEHHWLIRETKILKQYFPDIPLLVGGVHAIIYPHEILNDTPASLVCQSDGEEVLVHLLKELQKPSPNISSILGIDYKDDQGIIHHNNRAPLVQFEIDIIEDRNFYFRRYPQLNKDESAIFISSRGCPYSCSFCYNESLRNIFKNKGKYIRRKSPKAFVNEIKKNIFDSTNIFFIDDLFAFDNKWLEEFLPLYKKTIALNFMCTARANLMTDKIAHMLADAGCITVSFGIESGNDHIRNTVLNKNITDDQILQCSAVLKKYGIKTESYNIFCAPDETIDCAYQTIELNIKAKIDYAISSLLVPYPKTRLAEYCIKKSLLPENYSLYDIPNSAYSNSILNLPDKRKLTNVHYVLFLIVRLPFLYKIFKKLIKLERINNSFYYIYLLTNLWRYKHERNIKWSSALLFGWRMLKSMVSDE